jgi:predicted HAD superfamily phosphohydrolase
MERVKYIDHTGKKVLLFDFSNCKQSTEVFEIINKAKSVVGKEKIKTVRMLTDVSNTHYSVEVV